MKINHLAFADLREYMKDMKIVFLPEFTNSGPSISMEERVYRACQMFDKEPITMTPLQIQILLHYHTEVDDHPYLFNGKEAEVFKLFDLDMLKKTAYKKKSFRDCKLTDRGSFYVETLLSIQRPEPSWHIPTSASDDREADEEYC